MRIAHIADVHVKDCRRKEYAAVFAALAAQLKAEDPRPVAVAVAGDVFDTMSKASARNWEDVASLLSLLAAVAPVVVIPGNHDLNVRAAGAPDLLGPMLEAAGGARDLQQVTYWRASGVREFAGAVWAAGVPGQPPPTLEAVSAALAAAPPGTPLVGLYHESVAGARYSNGIEAREAPLDAKDLEALAEAAGPGRPLAVLLGDIHLRQEVSFPGSGAAAAAWYPGSLVCQNFGEPHLGHGYLLWDLEAGTTPAVRVTPRDVPNPRAPLTIRLGPAGEDLTFEPRPENPRAYRVVYDPAAPAEAVAEAVARAEKRHGCAPRDVEARGIPAPPRANGPSEGPRAALTAGGAWARHATLARELLEEAQIPPDIAKAALARYEAAVAASLGGRPAAQKVELSRLEFDNMFCYGPGNVVDFDALRRGRPGLVGFLAPNRAGKSSLFDVLTFALCDEVSRGEKRDVARLGGPGYRLRLTFRVDGAEGRLEKSGIRRGVKLIENTMRLWLGGEELSADTAPETAARARELLGSRPWLDSVTFLRPAEVSSVPSFALASAARRRETLSALLGLGSFEALLKKAGKELTELRGARRALLSRWPEAAAWKEGKAAAPLRNEGGEREKETLIARGARDDAQAAFEGAEGQALAAENALARVAAAEELAVTAATYAAKALGAKLAAAKEVKNASKAVAELEERTAAADASDAAADKQLVRAEAVAETAAADSEQTRTAVVHHSLSCLAEVRAALQVAESGLESSRLRLGESGCAEQPSPAACSTAEKPEPAEVADLDDALDALEQARQVYGSPRPSEHAAAEEVARLTAEAQGVRRNMAALAQVCKKMEIAAEDGSELMPAPVTSDIELGKSLKALDEARRDSRVHEDLRVKISSTLRSECLGCAATREALGGSAADKAAVLARRAALLRPAAFEILEEKAEALEAEAEALSAQARALLDERLCKISAAEASVGAAAKSRAIRDARIQVSAWKRERAAREAAAAEVRCAEKLYAVAKEALIAEESVAARLKEKAEKTKEACHAAKIALGQAAATKVALQTSARLAAAQVPPARERLTRAEDSFVLAEAEAESAADVSAEAAGAQQDAAQARAIAEAARAAAAAARAALDCAAASLQSAEEAARSHREAATAAVEADTTAAVCAAYRKIMHPKTGVSARLLAAAAGGVGAEVAAALKEMGASFLIEFGADCGLSLVDKKTGTRTPPALGSGYQQFVSALASRWALAKIARVPLPACFMIDEGFGCLDEINLTRVVEALKAMSLRAMAGGERPLVLAVTHREDMASYFAERLEITTGEEGSRVVYPPGAKTDLDGVITFHASRSLPRRCDERTDRPAYVEAGGKKREEEEGSAFHCKECEREIAPSRWIKHRDTAVHAKAETACAARDEIVAAHPGAGLALGHKIACLLCPGELVYTAKRWAKHAASAEHHQRAEILST